ncbi:MAG: hypothetical protein E6G61_00040 [Actinobacteria bacterium]|nr:MAG: hypothetical protein E6G61_00040 [Actinomycetota bacterium]
MAADRCPECLLTPQAEELLERLEAKLQRTRPGDASWETTICPRCGRLSGIFDEREGWSVGEGKDRGWASGPRPMAEMTPVGQPERAAVGQPERAAEERPPSGPQPVAEEHPVGSSKVMADHRPMPSGRLDLDTLPIPTWVTVREAAFLSRVSEEQVLEWIDKDIVEHEVILRDARHTGLVFVRTRDLDPALTRDAS